MEKKDLKIYETPELEVMDMELQGVLCISGDSMMPDSPGGDID